PVPVVVHAKAPGYKTPTCAPAQTSCTLVALLLRLVSSRIRRVGRAGELLLHLRAHRHVQIEATRRNRLREPFFIDRDPFRTLVESRGRGIDHLLELSIVLAQHD